MFRTLSDVLPAKSLAITKATALLAWVQCAKSVAQVITINATTSQCKNKAKYVNCGENHKSRSSDCDVWKKEKEVMKIKVTQ